MSAEAVANLARIWEKLRFARVERVIARDPEDILSIHAHHVTVFENGYSHLGHIDHEAPRMRRLSDIPKEMRHRTTVTWRTYYGFTDIGIFFHKEGYNELDLDVAITLDFGMWGNHMGDGQKPRPGDLLCGEIEEGPKGPRFRRWFVCAPSLKFLIDLTRESKTTLSENDLAHRLMCERFDDMLWAIARLVFFDNVAAFMEPYLTNTLTLHPCNGKGYGRPDFNGKQMIINHNGMYLPRSHAQFLHFLSFRLNQPQWWQQAKDLLGATPECVGHGGWCEACAAERDADLDDRGFNDWSEHY